MHGSPVRSEDRANQDPAEDQVSEDVVSLYRRMFDLTAPECRDTCKIPHSCCSSEYCGYARQWAKERWGVDPIPTNHSVLPYMGSNGCILEPHLRPMCTLHTCAINAFGFKPNDVTWTDEYFGLRELIEMAEYEWQHDNPRRVKMFNSGFF